MIGTRLDSRLPITLTILRRIILAASQLDDSFYYTCQPHLNQVLLNNRHEVQAIKIIFLSHKQNFKKAPFSLVVSRQNFLLPFTSSTYCFT